MATERENLDSQAQTAGFEALPALKSRLDDVNAATGEINAAYGRGEVDEKDYNEETKRLIESYRNLSKVVAEVEAAIKRESDAVERATQAKIAAFDKATEALKREIAEEDRAAAKTAVNAARAAADADKAAKVGRGIGDSTRALGQGSLRPEPAGQDFAQGGVPAIVNTFEATGRGLQAPFKGPMEILKGLPGLLTVAGTAVLEFGPKVVGSIKAIFDALSRDASRVVDQIEAFTAAIKKMDQERGDTEVKLLVDTRELDLAKGKFKDLQAVQAAWDAAPHKPTTAQPAAARQVAATPTRAEGGEAPVPGEVRATPVGDLEKTGSPIREANERRVDAGGNLVRPVERSDQHAVAQSIERSSPGRAQLQQELDRELENAIEALRQARANTKAAAERRLEAENTLIDERDTQGKEAEHGMKARDRAQNKAGRKDAAGVKTNVEARDDARDAEAKRSEGTLGQALQKRFEQLVDQNVMQRQAGGKALPESVLQDRLRQEITALSRQRNAGTGAAPLAAASIAGKAATAVNRRRSAAGVIVPNRRAIRPGAKPVVARRPVAPRPAATRPFVGPPKPVQRPARPIPGEVRERIGQGPQAALDALEQTQQAMAQTQAAQAQVLNRIARLEASAAQLRRQAGTLTRRALEHQPSALNSGAST